VILSNDRVNAVLFNIFGGITRCDEVANGLIEAFRQLDVGATARRSSSAWTARTTSKAGGCFAEADLPNVYTAATMTRPPRGRGTGQAGGLA